MDTRNLKLVKTEKTPLPDLPTDLAKAASEAEARLLLNMRSRYSGMVSLSPTGIKVEDLEILASYVKTYYRDLHSYLVVITGSVLKASLFHRRAFFCLSSSSIVKILNADADVTANFLKEHDLLSSRGDKLKDRVWSDVVSALERSGMIERIGSPKLGCATPFRISNEDIVTNLATHCRWTELSENVLSEQYDATIKFSQGNGKVRKKKESVSSNLADTES